MALDCPLRHTCYRCYLLNALSIHQLQQAMQVLSANERLCITLQLVDGQSIEQIDRKSVV